ncbi:hypothetical protein CTEN210_13097 [Chaetoceros tenuissimus]|uniref:Uncharacterized protein n=1 Tax=Chaetoceros tenuissimus TaxID=426638 RepID=A0AAD3D2H7_9STRA|nr:hypothetical protein CTEN210_13097 [Chaetoceros tenuissimus]
MFRNYTENLSEIYAEKISSSSSIKDIMKTIRKAKSHDVNDLCESFNFYDGQSVKSFFPSSELSFSSKHGFMEPLLPPMRHPGFCIKGGKYILSLDYIVHDFEMMCKSLRPYSRLIMIDLGADLTRENGPVIKLLDLYSKFGFEFDHIYGFEMVFSDPQKLYNDTIPEKYIHSFHWINAAVETAPKSKMNPLNSILEKYDDDDFIVVKLDVDHAETEIPLVMQILSNENISGKIDHLYFEHHVTIAEMRSSWGGSMNGTMEDSMKIFTALREKGIASHFWV